MKRIIILTVAICLIGAVANSLVPHFPYTDTLLTLMIIGVLIYAFFVGRQEYTSRKNRDSANEKVEIVKGTREEPLSNADITFLKKKMNRRMAAAMGAFLFIFCIYLVVTNFILPTLFGPLGEYLFWILSGAIFFAAVYLFGKHIQKLRQDIRSGKKLVVVGNVSRWEKYPYNDYEYVFYVDDIAFRVKSSIFEKYLKGDALEVHLFKPWQNTLLFEKKIENR